MLHRAILFLTANLFLTTANAMEGFTYSVKSIDKTSFYIYLKNEISRRDPKICPNETLFLIAAAEECEKHKFSYFDVGTLDAKQAMGFCFSSDQRKSLGITFADQVNYLLVENTNGKTTSSFKAQDKLLSLAGQRVSNVGEIKNLLSQERFVKMGTVEIVIERQGREMQIQEPLVLRNNANSSIKDIWAARTTCQENAAK